MRAKRFKESCGKLYGHFSYPGGIDFGYNSIDDRILDLMGDEDKFLEDLTDKEDDKNGYQKGKMEAGEILFHFKQGIIALAFSYGFTIGRQLDPGWGEAREAEEAILNDIRKEELLIYLPRKKAA